MKTRKEHVRQRLKKRDCSSPKIKLSQKMVSKVCEHVPLGIGIFTYEPSWYYLHQRNAAKSPVVSSDSALFEAKRQGRNRYIVDDLGQKMSVNFSAKVKDIESDFLANVQETNNPCLLKS